MRLNFSGVTEDDIREGVQRIGQIVSEQVELFGTLTGKPARGPQRPAEPAEQPDNVLELRRRKRA